MPFSRPRLLARYTLALALPIGLCLAVPPAYAQKHGDAPPAKATTPEPVKDKTPDELPPLPVDKSVQQTITINGKTLHYTATVSTIPVYNATDPKKPEKKTGEVVVTSYTLDTDGDKNNPAGSMDRPVTFAVNGGPGASSVYLNFGAIGPKHIEFAGQGDSPSDPPRLKDNPGTWLPFSDIVFIDPSAPASRARW